jgi:nucleoside-diphosphate-sugar epimerase
VNYLDNKKKILITGVNGFVGRNLVEFLSNYNVVIYGVGRRPYSFNRLEKYYQFDITNYSILQSVIKEIKPNLILNLASIVTASREYDIFLKMININLNVTYYFYQIWKKYNLKFDLFVNFGSVEEYGDYPGIICKENLWEKSSSPYAVSKTAATRFIYMAANNELFPAITVRPCMLFGEYQSEEKLIPYVINSLINNQEVKLTGCEQKRDFLYIKRFCNLLLSLICSEKYECGEIYNICSGIQFTLKDIILHIQEKLGASASKLLFGRLPYRKNEIMDSSISNKKLKDIIEFNIKKSDILDDLDSYLEKVKLQN